MSPTTNISQESMPEIVQDTKLDSRVQHDHTTHFTNIGRQKIEEHWKKEKDLYDGTVWTERCTQGIEQGKVRAVKQIFRSTGDGSYSAELLYELEAMAKFSQKRYRHCFVECFGWYEAGSMIFVAMEYFAHGDLSRFLHNKFPESEAANVTRQILEALEFMHNAGFTHRDLKPQNVLVRDSGPQWWVKLADFGVSKRIHERTLLRTWVGTPGYMAPEMMQCLTLPELSYTPKVDIWAIGVIAWRMVNNGILPTNPSLLQSGTHSADYVDFIRLTLSTEPDLRPTATAALQHGWIRDLGTPVVTRSPEIAPHIIRFMDEDDEDKHSIASSTEYKTGASRDSTVRKPAKDKDERSVASSTDYKTWASRQTLENATGDAFGFGAPVGNTSTTSESLVRSTSVPSLSHTTDRSSSNLSIPDQRDDENCQVDCLSRKGAARWRRDWACAWKLRESNSPADREQAAAECKRLCAEFTRLLDPMSETALDAGYHLAMSSELSNEARANLLLEVYPKAEKLLGSFHEKTLRYGEELGIALSGTALRKHGEKLLRSIFTHRYDTKGLSSPQTLRTGHYLGVVLVQQGDRYAWEHLERIYYGRKAVLGQDSRETLESGFWLGIAQMNRGEYRQAEQLFSDVYDLRQIVLGFNHIATLTSGLQLGIARAKGRRYQEARTILAQVYDSLVQTHGPDHQLTRKAKDWLAAVRKPPMPSKLPQTPTPPSLLDRLFR